MILLMMTYGLKYSLKKMGEKNKEELILKLWIEVPDAHKYWRVLLGVKGNLMQKITAFLLPFFSWWWWWRIIFVELLTDERCPSFQLGRLSEILTIANLQYTSSRIWICTEPEFRLCWISCVVLIINTPVQNEVKYKH